MQSASGVIRINSRTHFTDAFLNLLFGQERAKR